MVRILLVLALLSLVRCQEVQWKSALELSMGGQAFPVETLQMPYDRLPADAQNVVTEGVWTQAVESASIYVDFMSNTDQIYVNFTLYNSNTDFDNMDALGHSSVDLYAWDTNTTMFRWISTYQSPQYPNNYGLLAQGLAFTSNALTHYRLNFPLYNRVSAMYIGVPDTKVITKIKKTEPPVIVWYGTSIAQGKSASIPSAAYINQLNLANYPKFQILNFGFSSNGKMDSGVMSYLNSIPDPIAFVIDCLPNMSYDEVANNTVPLVESIRSTHDNKEIPIILVESAIYGSEWWDSTMRYNQQKKRDTLRAQYEVLLAQQYTDIQYVEGSGLISPQEIAMCYSVDGTHPNDLGMNKMFSFWNNYLNTMF